MLGVKKIKLLLLKNWGAQTGRGVEKRKAGAAVKLVPRPLANLTTGSSNRKS